ncbi:AAA-domain-containing protein [Hypomontagnella monticulosa]|nr:AAA-domain-containing protein [Hypomontagnella monticulosa]
MHTLSLRAFRSAALTLQRPPIATRTGRLFHASAVSRAADDSNTGPRDDGSKPEKENGNGDNENGDENIFGENTTAANGESQGRKRAGNGSLRSRTLRNRKPEELPPVNVPKSFLSSAISRSGETGQDHVSGHIHERDVRIMLENALLHSSPEQMSESHLAYILESTTWSGESLGEILKALESSEDGQLVHRKGDIMVAAAYWAAALSAREAYGKDAADKLLKHDSIAGSRDLWTTFTYVKEFSERNKSLQPSHAAQIISSVVDHSPLEASTVSWFDENLVREIMTSVKADLLVQAPKNVKLADLRRPITIMNTPEYSGSSVARDIVRHVATKAGADVLHLSASDIAHIVGSYLGQDAVRAAGLISLLGYKAAENSGRLGAGRAIDEEPDGLEDIRIPYTIIMRDERLKKENKRYISLMDDFLNGTNRVKSDELWEDLKVNTVLEELIHSADSESTEQAPLIVHIDDFNALNMDLECGATIIGKLRKVVDGLWIEGRKIALVGSCSTKGAPRPYLNALKDLESSERVTTLRLALPRPAAEPQILSARAAALEAKRELLERKDYIRENERNIVRVLSSMVEPVSDDSVSTTEQIGLTEIDSRKLPKSWVNSVLPLNEVYRVATMIIGLSTDLADVFSVNSMEKAIDEINKLQQIKEVYAKNKPPAEKSQRKETRELLDPRRLGLSEEDHEEALESGLVNAKDLRTTFKDVHAPAETIESVKMLTTLSLIRPEAFSYGVLATDRIPGCLLYGPPGTGKTLLAKAVAKESGANMIEISGASINNKYVGESEKNVRALFRLAKKKEPLVIFIDEADALLGARGRRDLGSRRETINQFLREWDGMDKMKAFIMVATNRPFDLDEAVLRRLPRKLLIDLPLEADRAAILRIHLKDEILDEATVNLEDIAKRTPLYSGSDLKNVCVAAAMAAVKEELELEQQRENEVQGSETTQKRRVLAGRHFDKALREIGASVSEDMATLTAIRKFDEKYGDGGAARRRRRRGMGFQVVAEVPDAQEARVRSGR